MSDESAYLIYFIEQYALRKDMAGGEVFSLFEQRGLIPYIQDMYYTYHTETVENAIADIDRKLSGAE